MKRVVFDIILIVCIFLLPWWVTLIWATIGLFVFVNFYEFLISCIIVYVISTDKEAVFIDNSLLVYSSIAVFYLVAQFLRRHIILYKNEIPYKS